MLSVNCPPAWTRTSGTAPPRPEVSVVTATEILVGTVPWAWGDAVRARINDVRSAVAASRTTRARGRALRVDRARVRGHPAESRLRAEDGPGRVLPGRRPRRDTVRGGTAQRRTATVVLAAGAGGRRRGDRAVQLPADPVDPLGG